MWTLIAPPPLEMCYDKEPHLVNLLFSDSKDPVKYLGKYEMLYTQSLCLFNIYCYGSNMYLVWVSLSVYYIIGELRVPIHLSSSVKHQEVSKNLLNRAVY